MATRTFAYRVGLDGKDGFVRGFREMGDAGEAEYRRLGSAAERSANQAAAAADRARKAAAAFALAQPSPVAANINAATGVTGERKSARDSAAAIAQALAEEEAAARQLKAAIDPLWAAEQRLAAETAKADQLLRRKAITEKEHAAALALARQEYARTETAVRRLGQAHGFAAHEASNLVAQANDVVVGLGSGQAFFTVLLQQGAQVVQMLGNRPGGMGAGFAALARLVPPGVVVLGGAAAVLALVAKAGYDAGESQRKAAVATAGLGRAAGVTARQLEDQAQAGARAGEVSTIAAREMAAAFVSTGRIGGTVIGDLIALQRDYAVATGRDSKAATERLAETFAEPTKGAAELNRELGFLNATQLAHIQQLEEEGRRTQAQKVLADELKSSVAGMAQTYGGFGEAVRQVGVAYSFLADNAARAQQFMLLGPFAGDFRRRVEEQQQAQSLLAQINGASARARDTRLSLFPDGRGALETQQSSLNRGLRANLIGGEFGEALKNRDALNATTRALQSYLLPAEKAHQLALVDIEATRAKTAAQKGALAARRVEIEYAGVAITQTELEQRKKDAAALASARAASAGGARAQSLVREAAAMEVSAAQALKVADAYLESEDAGRLAEARRKALTEATRRGVDVEARARREIAIADAERVADLAKQVALLGVEAEAQKRVTDLIASGQVRPDQARGELDLQMALVRAGQASAEVQAKLTGVVDRQRDAQARLNAERAREGLLGGTQEANDRITALQLEARYAGDVTGEYERRAAVLRVMQSPDYRNTEDPEARQAAIDAARKEADQQRTTDRAKYAADLKLDFEERMMLGRAELGLIGRSASEHDRIVGKLELILDLKRRGFDLSSAEAQAILQAADNAAELDRQLRTANDNWREFQGIGERVVDDILNPQNWDDWGDLGKRVLNDLMADLWRLGAVNPLKNWLFGTELPTTAGLGGFLGSLGGGARRGDGAGAGSSIVAGEWDWFANDIWQGGDEFVLSLGEVFDANTRGGFMAALTNLLSQGFGGGGLGSLPGMLLGDGRSRDAFDFSGADFSGWDRDSTLSHDADPFDFRLSLGNDPLGIGNALDDEGRAFTLGLEGVFADNTGGGFLAALSGILTQGLAGLGGGGGGGGWLDTLLSVGKSLAGSFGGGGGAGFFTHNPGVGGFDFKMPSYAIGTDNHPGGLAKVHRDELLAWMPKGAQVFTAAETRRLLGGGGQGGDGVRVSLGDVIIHAQGSGPREVDAIRSEIAELRRTLPMEIVNTVNTGLSRRRVVI